MVGIAVGKIKNGQRLALGLVWLLLSQQKRIFDSTWSEIMEYRMWAVVGIAVGKIGNGQRMACWLVMMRVLGGS